MKAGRPWQKSARGTGITVVRTKTFPRAGLVRTGGRLPPRASGELKNIDTRTLNTMVVAGATTGKLLLLNPVIQGSSATTRLGRRITMVSLQCVYSMSFVPTTTGNSSLRFMIIYDKQTNATAMTAAQLLTTDEMNGLLNLDNARRFRVIMDKVYPIGFSTSGPTCFLFKKWMKLNLPVEFNTGNAGTVGDITTGSLYLFVWQDGNLATASPQSIFTTRIRFSDN